MIYKNFLITMCCVFAVIAPCRPAKATFQFFDPGLAIELTALEAMADYLLGVLEDAVDGFLQVFEEETAELKITDATAKAEMSAQTSATFASLKAHALSRNITANTDIWSPLAQSDFACTSECMKRSILLGHRAPAETADKIAEVATDFNQAYSSWDDLFNSVSTSYTSGATNGLTDGRRLLPTGQLTDSHTELAQQIIMLTNPIPAIDRSGYGNDSTPKDYYETLRTTKNMALAITQRVLGHQAGDIAPAYSLSSDSWASELESSLGGNMGDVDFGQNISARGALNLQVKSRYANPNWHIDMHRKTPTGGLRTLAAMNAVQLELKKKLYFVNQDNVILQATLSSLESNALYREQIDRFHSDMVKE